jgi:hypothetical protein
MDILAITMTSNTTDNFTFIYWVGHPPACATLCRKSTNIGKFRNGNRALRGKSPKTSVEPRRPELPIFGNH